ncbi:ATP-binding protein [Streptomyces sp. NPDC048415]|uniref:ATP-binding protein n=1 Tax=Streptomyces sp. NPDC048415 TaxID=3154822 RepID=UPI00341CBA46
MEDFDFDHQRSVKREAIAHLGTLDFVVGKENVIFLGPPGTGEAHLDTGLGIRACHAGHRVAFATAAQTVARPPTSTKADHMPLQQTLAACTAGSRPRIGFGEAAVIVVMAVVPSLLGTPPRELAAVLGSAGVLALTVARLGSVGPPRALRSAWRALVSAGQAA